MGAFEYGGDVSVLIDAHVENCLEALAGVGERVEAESVKIHITSQVNVLPKIQLMVQSRGQLKFR